MEGSDLDTTLNPGATYYAEAQLVTPHEYAWCQANAGQCNMYNNVSYRQFTVVGTTSFSFTGVGDTVRMTPAINAWTGATINAIEPAPGVDGRAFIGYKVTAQLRVFGIMNTRSITRISIAGSNPSVCLWDAESRSAISGFMLR